MRRALIIGNSDGIGLSLTERLLGLGFDITGISRRPSTLSERTEAAGIYAHTVIDVASPEYPDRLRRLLAERGPFDLCVYCAGIGDRLDPTDLSGEPAVFRVNLVGAVETASIVVAPMIAARRGHFVALSSIGDEALSAVAPSYAASKAGLSSYLAGLALALRPYGVAVSNVRLGFVDTKMAKSSLRPMMISVGRAVDVVVGCLESRRPRVTFPLAMAVCVRVLRFAALLVLWLRTPPRGHD